MSRTTFLVLLAGSLLTATAWAADDAFTGKWKLDPEKSVMTDQMKVDSLGGNKWALNFSGDNVETVIADGTDQPGLYGSTVSITVGEPNTMTVVRKKDGRMWVKGVWTLSADGSTLHDDFTGYQPDGSTQHLDYLYKRDGGGAGFSGTWVSISEKRDKGFEVEIRPFEEDGLSFDNKGSGMITSVKFDGKEYPSSGANAVEGYMTSATRVDAHTLHVTHTLKGKVLDTQEMVVSPDGKTITISVNQKGRSKPNVLVFERE